MTARRVATDDRHYAHVQGVAASTWVVTHGMGKYPAVEVVTSAGDVVFGNVHYDSPDQITLTFGAAFAGRAYLN